MMTITVTTDEGEQQITTIDDYDPERAVEAHGYALNNASYSVEKGVKEKQEELEQRIEELEGLL